MNAIPAGPSMRQKIGLSAPLLTPFAPDYSIDWVRYAGHARRLLDGGMKVVTAFGTTGEGSSIGQRERFELYDRMSAAGVEPGHLVECIYATASADAGDHIRRSLGTGCAGILLPPPFYLKDVSEEGVFRWFAEMFDLVGAGLRDVILYNYPALTGITIGPELTGRLREAYPGVIGGVKDSSGQWEQTTALIAAHPDLAILVGHEGYLAAAVRLGASGSISGISNVGPTLISKLVAGTDDPFIDEVLTIVRSLPVVPAIKAILASQTGDDAWRRTRAPLLTISRAEDLADCAALAARLS
jgi:4-hydroxy-tetrahydrodipicolinate synthase